MDDIIEIPCEFCGSLIPSIMYQNHILGCIASNINSRINYLQNQVIEEGEEEGEENSLEEERENDENSMISVNMFRNILNSMSTFRPEPVLWIQLSNATTRSFYQSNEYEMNTILGELMGRVEVGLTSEEFELVTKLINKEECKDDRCPICLENYEEKEFIRKIKCSHIFCEECILKWLSKHKKCPCCQIDLEDRFIK